MGKFIRFKKRKWNIFKSNFTKFNCRKKTVYNNKFFSPNQSQYKLYDHVCFSLSSYENYYKNKFKSLIQTKQKLSLFYGGLSKNYLKSIIRNPTFNYVNYIIETLESRLD